MAAGAAAVLDLGCGSGALLRRLALEERFTRIIGVDTSATALLLAERLLSPIVEVDGGRVSLRHLSFSAPDARLEAVDAVVMVETIEHIDPEHLSRVERAVFEDTHPPLVLITTPNSEYNPLFGIPEGERRHADHRFEWSRAKFRTWARGVGERNGYDVEHSGVGPADPFLGSPTQMAVFRSR